MRNLLLGVAAAALAMTMATPGAASLTLSSGAVPAMTYTSVGAITGALTGGSYSGVGTVVIQRASSASSLCTGALLSAQVVITAGHCLSNVVNGLTDAVTSVRLVLPSLGEFAPGSVFSAASWEVSPLFNNVLTDGNDFALFTLEAPTTGFASYKIFEGVPLDEFTRVGTGTMGGPVGIGTEIGNVFDFRQREGRNLYEVGGAQVGIDPFILLSDFDDGTETHDVFGQNGLGKQTGIAGESHISNGDSGGPTFIDGQIVAVGSFLLTGGAFPGTPGCGESTSVDPYGVGGSTGAGIPIEQCTNGSVGEIAGDTWLLPHLGFIQAYVAANTVPEPSTWAQMIAGLGLLGGVLRGRRRAIAVA